jgi:hypothetical protein
MDIISTHRYSIGRVDIQLCIYNENIKCIHDKGIIEVDKNSLIVKKWFEDTKGVIRIRISRKNIQHNG